MLSKNLLPAARSLTSSQFHALPRLRSPAAAAIRPTISTSIAASRQFPVRRWYSENADAKKEEGKSEGKDATPSAEEALKTELEAKKKEVIDLKDKYLRSVADFRNLQERSKREAQAARDFALQKFAKDLIDSIDNLDRALHVVGADRLAAPTIGNLSPEEIAEFAQAAHQDLTSLHSGLKMTESIMMSTLEKHGLTRFDPAEKLEKFDPNKHEATFQAPQPDKEDGAVFHTQQKGFSLNGRVLRAAKVGVVKNS